MLDADGPWSLAALNADQLRSLLDALPKFESMTMDEVFSGEPGKDYRVEDLPTRSARERLVTLSLDDQTQISRIRLGGRPRLYGFRVDNVFHVLWWDPEHQIWPSMKKNT